MAQKCVGATKSATIARATDGASKRDGLVADVHRDNGVKWRIDGRFAALPFDVSTVWRHDVHRWMVDERVGEHLCGWSAFKFYKIFY